MDAIIYVGPMERDVQFKVIPKMDTLTLVEAIEDEVEDIATEETASDESEAVSSHEEDLAVAAEKKENSNLPLLIGGVIVVAVIGALVITKVKKK